MVWHVIICSANAVSKRCGLGWGDIKTGFKNSIQQTMLEWEKAGRYFW